MPNFQFYPAEIKASSPIGSLSLERFLKSIKEPKPSIKDIFQDIHDAEISGNLKLKAELKTKLFSFTPAINVKGRRRYKDIINFTGLMPLDFDHLASREEAEQFRDHLFNDFNFIVSSWLSSSGRGVRALVRIPVLSGDSAIKTFKGYFNGLAKLADFEGYVGFDYAPKNCVLPLFLSYDKGLKARPFESTEVWTHEYKEQEIVQEVMPPRSSSVNTNLNERRIAGIVRSGLSKITDAGHLILRSVSYVVGGYVGGGEIDFYFAEKLLHEEIDGHFYLRQKSSTYKKTATEMLNRGIKAPVRLN